LHEKFLTWREQRLVLNAATLGSAGSYTDHVRVDKERGDAGLSRYSLKLSHLLAVPPLFWTLICSEVDFESRAVNELRPLFCVLRIIGRAPVGNNELRPL
jgi:hypothetical protein